MRVFLSLVLLIAVVLVAAAAATRPNQADAEAVLKRQLLDLLAREELGSGQGAGRNLALAFCKLKPNDCFEVVRTQIDAEFTDHRLYVIYSIRGFGRHARCIGAFMTFVCPGGLEKG